MEAKDAKAYWSKGGQVFFIDGWAWGVSANLLNISLGKEADILDAITNNKSMGNPVIDNILTTERNLS